MASERGFACARMRLGVHWWEAALGISVLSFELACERRRCPTHSTNTTDLLNGHDGEARKPGFTSGNKNAAGFRIPQFPFGKVSRMHVDYYARPNG